METLLLFARAPVAGAVQTRLAVERGEALAHTLGVAALLDLADTCGRWRSQRLGADLNRRVALYVEAAIEQGIEHPVLVEAAQRAGARLEVQKGSSLNERLRQAFDDEYERGARSVCAISVDTPTLPAHLLDEAFRALVWERAVLGPTFDGGCWLLGAQRPAPDLFHDAPWHSPAGLVHTISRLRVAGVDPHLLPFWYELGGGADVDRLLWHVRSLRTRQPALLSETWRALHALGLVAEGDEP